MSSLFPDAAPSRQSDGSITRDQIIVIITETRTQVQNLEKTLTNAVVELRRSVEELVDRFESDAEDFRKSLSGLGDLKNGHIDLGRRLGEMDVRASKLDDRTKQLEDLALRLKTVIGVVAFVGGGVGAAVGFVLSHLWPGKP